MGITAQPAELCKSKIGAKDKFNASKPLAKLADNSGVANQGVATGYALSFGARFQEEAK
jgi:hypothetical protein